MSRRFGLPTALLRVMYRADLVKRISSGTVLYAGDGTRTKGITREAFLEAIKPLLGGQPLPPWINLHDTADEATAGGTRNTHISDRTVAWVQGREAHFISGVAADGCFRQQCDSLQSLALAISQTARAPMRASETVVCPLLFLMGDPICGLHSILKMNTNKRSDSNLCLSRT